MEQPGVSRDMEVFNRYLAGWLENGLRGKWAVISDGTLVGIYPSWGAAVRGAADSYVRGRALVQPIQPELPPHAPWPFSRPRIRIDAYCELLPVNERADPRGDGQP